MLLKKRQYDMFEEGVEISAVKRRYKKENLTQVDGHQQTMLHVLCMEPHPNMDVIIFILQKDEQEKTGLIRARDVNAWTPLICACSSSADFELIQQLVKHGADVKETNADGTSPLHYFARHSPPPQEMETWKRSLAFLISKGAYINITNKNNETPLHSHVMYKANYEMFMCLLLHHADPNIATKHGETVLHYAIRSGNKNIIQKLLDPPFSMDLLLKTGVSGSPLDLAEKDVRDPQLLEFLHNYVKRTAMTTSSPVPTLNENLRSNSTATLSASTPATAGSISNNSVVTPKTPTGTATGMNTPTTSSKIEGDQILIKMLSKKRAWHIDYNELEVGERIGKGAFGAVYKATWRGTTVAMKKINQTNMSQSDTETFFREIRTVSKLRHPNVILFLGASLNDPICFITEFASKGDLYTVLHDPKNVDLSWKIKLKICVDSARGLLYLHCCSPAVVHRDLKSLNLLVTDDSFNIKLTDFGISKPLENNLETLNSKMGTLNWLAPEVLDCKPYSLASDVYSFGIILWEVVTQKTPFSGMHNFQILSSVARGKGLGVPEGVDKKFGNLMEAMWVVEPKDRPGMKEVLEVLLDVQRRYEQSLVKEQELLLEQKPATPNSNSMKNSMTNSMTNTTSNSNTNNDANSQIMSKSLETNGTPGGEKKEEKKKKKKKKESKHKDKDKTEDKLNGKESKEGKKKKTVKRGVSESANIGKQHLKKTHDVASASELTRVKDTDDLNGKASTSSPKKSSKSNGVEGENVEEKKKKRKSTKAPK